MPDQNPGYPIAKVVALTGLSERQLAYWRRTGLLSPSSRTRGGHARYGFPDLVALRAAKKLLDAGVSLQRVRHAVASLQRFLPGLDQPLAEASIVVTGDVLLVMHRGSRFDALSGQEWILPIADLIHELDRDKRHVGTPLQTELFPETVATPAAPAGRARRQNARAHRTAHSP
jgi:DNA-binding transcriptional MerR regulator